MSDTTKTCRVCLQPIVNQPDYVKYHEDCLNCVHCEAEVHKDIIAQLIKEQSKESEIEEQIRVYHRPCESQAIEKQLGNKDVTIKQSHLDHLNSALLLFDPNMGVSVETNQKLAEYACNQFIHTMSLEQKFIVMKRLEAVAAMVSISLARDKQHIEARLAETDRIRAKDLDNANERIEIEKKRIKKRETEAKRLSPELRARENSIKGLVAIGIPRQQAEQMIDAQSKGGTQ